MSSQATGLRVASAFFAIFAVAHAIRLIKQIQVMFSSVEVPMWASVIALIVAGFLSIWFWRLSARG
jgi:hypothetical protein